MNLTAFDVVNQAWPTRRDPRKDRSQPPSRSRSTSSSSLFRFCEITSVTFARTFSRSKSTVSIGIRSDSSFKVRISLRIPEEMLAPTGSS